MTGLIALVVILALLAIVAFIAMVKFFGGSKNMQFVSSKRNELRRNGVWCALALIVLVLGLSVTSYAATRASNQKKNEPQIEDVLDDEANKDAQSDKATPSDAAKTSDTDAEAQETDAQAAAKTEEETKPEDLEVPEGEQDSINDEDLPDEECADEFSFEKSETDLLLGDFDTVKQRGFWRGSMPTMAKWKTVTQDYTDGVDVPEFYDIEWFDEQLGFNQDGKSAEWLDLRTRSKIKGELDVKIPEWRAEWASYTQFELGEAYQDKACVLAQSNVVYGDMIMQWMADLKFFGFKNPRLKKFAEELDEAFAQDEDGNYLNPDGLLKFVEPEQKYPGAIDHAQVTDYYLEEIRNALAFLRSHSKFLGVKEATSARNWHLPGNQDINHIRTVEDENQDSHTVAMYAVIGKNGGVLYKYGFNATDFSKVDGHVGDMRLEIFSGAKVRVKSVQKTTTSSGGGGGSNPTSNPTTNPEPQPQPEPEPQGAKNPEDSAKDVPAADQSAGNNKQSGSGTKNDDQGQISKGNSDGSTYKPPQGESVTPPAGSTGENTETIQGDPTVGSKDITVTESSTTTDSNGNQTTQDKQSDVSQGGEVQGSTEYKDF